MMHHATTQALGQARITELHRQAQRAALARAARQPRRADRQLSWQPGRGILVTVTARVHRPSLAAEC